MRLQRSGIDPDRTGPTGQSNAKTGEVDLRRKTGDVGRKKPGLTSYVSRLTSEEAS